MTTTASMIRALPGGSGPASPPAPGGPRDLPALTALLKDYGAILRAEADACMDSAGVCRDDADAARINQMMRLYRDAWAELTGLSGPEVQG